MQTKKILKHLVPFPFDAESDQFTAALASALILAQGYTEETPYWCAPNRRYCIHCRPCGDNLLERHQLSLYHCLLTASTLAFGFDYPSDDTVAPHSLPGFPEGWRWDEGFMEALARFAGFTYRRFDVAAPQGEVLSAVKGAVDAGFPALLRLEDDLAWVLAVGYEGDQVCGLDSALRPLPEGWQGTLRDAIVLTGNTPPRMDYREFLERIAAALSYEGHEAVEGAVMEALDRVTPENAMDIAGMLCGITGVFIEARWHAAEAFSGGENLISQIVPDRDRHDRLTEVLLSRYLLENHDESHGIGWKIWAALGVGTKTDYQITPQSAGLVLQRENQEMLKGLFAKVFENDRAVCRAIRDYLEE